MRILFLDQFTDWGGAQLGLRDIMTEVQARGWEPYLMAPGDGPMVRFCESAGISFERLALSHYANGRKSAADLLQFGFDSARSFRQVRDMVRRRRIDLVFVNGPRALPAASASECPIIFHAHSRPNRRYARALTRWCVRCGGATVISVSRFVAAGLPSGATVICNGVDDAGYVARPRSQGAPRIGIVGRISPEKGHMDFLRAAQQMGGSTARFLVFGAALFSNSSYEDVVRRAAGDNVEFRGWTDDVPAALHEIDILAVPSSEMEACPRIVLEALSAGTPIVAYPSGGIPELITNGETGVLTREATPAALTDSIQRLLECPELMERCSRLGRQDWEARFSSAGFRRDVGDLIQRVALRSTGSRAAA